jgi:hypothetical protein
MPVDPSLGDAKPLRIKRNLQLLPSLKCQPLLPRASSSASNTLLKIISVPSIIFCSNKISVIIPLPTSLFYIGPSHLSEQFATKKYAQKGEGIMKMMNLAVVTTLAILACIPRAGFAKARAKL